LYELSEPDINQEASSAWTDLIL